MTNSLNQFSEISDVDITDLIEVSTSGAIGHFYGCTLHSVFQPVYSFSHKKPIGYEALLRAVGPDDVPVSPQELFSSITYDQDLIQLEQLAITLHVLNFMRNDPDDSWLFLNVNPRLIRQNHACLRRLLELLNLYEFQSTRIVVEFVEDPVADVDILKRAAQFMQQGGCLIAIDDFGTSHSSFTRVWDLQPDIVKLDKSILDRATATPTFRRSLIGLVELLHESGALVLMEGIEDLAGATLAYDVNIDFHQGYFYGHPARQLQTIQEKTNPYLERFDADQFHSTSLHNSQHVSDTLLFLFRQSASGTMPEVPLEQSCYSLLNHPHVICVYLLDSTGYQIGDTKYGQHATQSIEPRFRVLRHTQGVNWSSRMYFRRAMAKQDSIQTTRPYLSLTGAHLCVTLSIAIQSDDLSFILCCDIRAQED